MGAQTEKIQDMSKNRTRIEYRTYQSINREGPFTVHLFYPDGVWDEWKLTREEARKRYPSDRFEWVHRAD